MPPSYTPLLYSSLTLPFASLLFVHSLNCTSFAQDLALYLRYVAPFIDSYLPGYLAYFTNRCADSHRPKKTCASDMYIWAVLMQAWPLAKVLFGRTKNPVRAGLMGATLCRTAARESRGLMPMEQAEMERHALIYEDWAVGVVGQLSEATAAE